jgi:hypothetical protein
MRRGSVTEQTLAGARGKPFHNFPVSGLEILQGTEAHIVILSKKNNMSSSGCTLSRLSKGHRLVAQRCSRSERKEQT